MERLRAVGLLRIKDTAADGDSCKDGPRGGGSSNTSDGGADASDSPLVAAAVSTPLTVHHQLGVSRLGRAAIRGGTRARMHTPRYLHAHTHTYTLRDHIVVVLDQGSITTTSWYTVLCVSNMLCTAYISSPLCTLLPISAGCVELSISELVYSDLLVARSSLAVHSRLHLLYLVTPYTAAQDIPLIPQVFFDAVSFIDSHSLAYREQTHTHARTREIYTQRFCSKQL